MSRDILNFLREGELPHRDRVRAVHREAQYYAIGPLLDNLEDIQPLTGEKVRQSFLDLLPYYKGDRTPRREQHSRSHTAGLQMIPLEADSSALGERCILNFFLHICLDQSFCWRPGNVGA